jgi:hypothetical protein
LALARKRGVWHAYEDTGSPADVAAEVSNREIESALTAILLDDVYLDAFCTRLAPENVINVIYEDVIASARATTADVIKLCSLQVELGRDERQQVAKLIPTEAAVKKQLTSTFCAWLAENYHSVQKLAATGPPTPLD